MDGRLNSFNSRTASAIEKLPAAEVELTLIEIAADAGWESWRRSGPEDAPAVSV